jgi:hypothetical protein
MTIGTQSLSIDLGDGAYLQIDAKLLSGPVVPKPRPQQLADLVLDVASSDADVPTGKVGITATVVNRS